ncbi:hypothetical protein AB0937_35335 [Streptomyces sp. NPDC047880]|uniref:hypothetical protein n=1 Tax=Streptomyces sp. NPDC047880 TaxID=3155626 RepID=UPI00345335C6
MRTTSEAPVPVKVRSRVSGWTTRTPAAKSVKKAPPAARLAALFLASHASSKLHGTLPDTTSGFPTLRTPSHSGVNRAAPARCAVAAVDAA